MRAHVLPTDAADPGRFGWRESRRALGGVALVGIEPGDNRGAIGRQALQLTWAEEVGRGFGGWGCLGCHGIR